MLVKDLMEKLSKMDAEKEINISESAWDDAINSQINILDGIDDSQFDELDADGEPVELSDEEKAEREAAKEEREKHSNFLKGVKGLKDAGMGKAHMIYAPGGNPNDSVAMGGYLSDETPTENRRKRVIAIVKNARDGEMYGQVDDVDMSKYDEYKAWYDEHSEDLRRKYAKFPEVTDMMDDIDSHPEDTDYDHESFEESVEETKAKEKLEKARKDFNESLKDDFDRDMDLIKALFE